MVTSLVVPAWPVPVLSIWFVALEGASPSAALSGSWQLLKNHTVSGIVVFVLLGVVNAVASSIVLATLLTAPLSMIFGTLDAPLNRRGRRNPCRLERLPGQL